jgi:hypothetical protein
MNMQVNQLIASYVADVSSYLPRRSRKDVAFELQALLAEELQGKADDAGRAADEAMAMELLRNFGRPEDVAVRYAPAVMIIEPADGRSFLRASIVGIAVIWVLGLVHVLRDGENQSLLRLFAQWWDSSVLPSLWWPGLLVTCFGIAAWTRRVWPQSAEWKPKARRSERASPSLLVIGVAAIVSSLVILLNPALILDMMFGGRAAPAAYDAFTYSGTFRRTQAPLLLVLLALNIPLYFTVALQRRWTVLTRRIETGLSVLLVLVMVWALVGGSIMVGEGSNEFVKFSFGLIIFFTILDLAVKAYRGSRPAAAPDPRLNA